LALGVLILPVTMNFLLDFGTVLTVCYLSFFILWAKDLPASSLLNAKINEVYKFQEMVYHFNSSYVRNNSKF
jgi:hypothetical protein